MTPTKQDIGRIVRKRDNHNRRFVIVEVLDADVTLSDLVFVGTPDFIVSDLRTYEFIGSKEPNNHD